jgi:protease-4
MSEQKGVRAIVLDINSPGGSVGAVQELYMQILRVRREKHIPVVALFDDVAASGGYYIAMACDRVVAHPGSLTGSIGVIFNVSNLQGLFGKIGYKVDPIKSGKHKDIGSPARPMTEEERRLLQSLIMDAYDQFVKAVAEGRQLPEDKVREFADGSIFSGRQALERKMVDKLGDSTDAIELAGQLAGIQGRPKVRRDTERITDIFDLLDTKFEGLLRGETSALADRLISRARGGLEYRWEGW